MFTPANYPAPPPVTFEANPIPEHQQPPPTNVIADSFSNSAAAGNWNWNAVDSNANQVELIRKPAVFNKMSTSAIGKIQTSAESVPSVNPYNTNQPDDMKSQNYGSHAGPEAQQPQFNQQTFAGDEMDPLDMALMQMNVQSDQQQPSFNAPALDNGASFFGPPQPTTGGISLPNSSYAAPAPMEEQLVENQQVVEAIQQPEVPQSGVGSQFVAPPPPVTATPPLPTASPALTGGPPPSMGMGMMPPPGGKAINPFKRCGTVVPRNTFFEPPTNAPALPPPQPTPPPPAVQEPMQIIPPEQVQEQEPIMHGNNDRNEYLQTDQLSEEIVVQNSGNTAESYDHLPPPGLSRLVLGETEDQHYNASSGGAVQSVSTVTSLPPPGLNRMIPGTDLEGAAPDVAMQRGADGQDDDNAAVGSAYPPAPPSDLTDRNLYQVPGEDHQQQQPPPSRVVTGDENAMPFVAVQQPAPEFPAAPVNNMGAEEQRDLQPVDGENARDDDNVRFNRQHGEQILSRDEPIEGENAGDDVVISSGGGAAVVTTEVADISSVGGDGGSVSAQAAAAAPPPPSANVQRPRKETSTGEDSEERDRAAYYKAKNSRRHEDTGSLRRKPKQQPERYDSESDNSEKRDHRKNVDRSYASERHRGDDRDGRRRRGEETTRQYRSERDRRYADDFDRSGGYGRGEERRSKRYNEDERDDRRRTEGDAKRADKERQYRKDRDRERDDPRRFREKDRRYDYEDERYNRSGSRNTDRSRDPRYGSNAGYGYPQS